jgi:hypothetical protein
LPHGECLSPTIRRGFLSFRELLELELLSLELELLSPLERLSLLALLSPLELAPGWVPLGWRMPQARRPSERQEAMRLFSS